MFHYRFVGEMGQFEDEEGYQNGNYLSRRLVDH